MPLAKDKAPNNGCIASAMADYWRLASTPYPFGSSFQASAEILQLPLLDAGASQVWMERAQAALTPDEA